MNKRVRRFPAALFLVLALMSALWGQSVWMEQGFVVDSILLFLLAAVLVHFSLRRVPVASCLASETTAHSGNAPPLISDENSRKRILLGALVSALVAFLCFGGNRVSGLGVSLCVFSVLLIGLAAGRRPEWWRQGRRFHRGGLALHLSGFFLVILAVTILGLTIRLYGIAELPLDMNSAHVEELLEVDGILGGEPQIFFQRSIAREPLFLYMTAFLVWATPLSIGFMALKIASVLSAVMAIPFTGLLGREVFGRAGGIFAGLLLAFSHWHLVASRNGFQQGLAVSVSAAFLYFWLRACRRDKRNDWLAAGALAGIGLLSSWYLWPLALLLLLTPVSRALVAYVCRMRVGEVSASESPSVRVTPGNTGLGLVATVLVANPLIHYALSNPERFWTGFASGIDNLSGISWVEILVRISSNLWKALLMFNVRTAPHWVEAVGDYPALGWVTAALFLVGVLMIVAAWRHQKAGWMAVLALPLLMVLLLPVALNIRVPASVPSVARAAGALPLVCVIAAFPLVWLRCLKGEFRRMGRLFLWVVLILLFVQVLLDCRKAYFDKYAASYEARSWNHREVGEVVRGYRDALGTRIETWVVEYPHWIDYRAVGIESGAAVWPHLIRDLRTTDLKLDRSSPQLFLLHQNDQEALDHLMALFPSAAVQKRSGRAGKDFVVVYLAADAETQVPLENR